MWGREDYTLHDLVHKIQQIELNTNDVRTIFELISQTIDQHMGRHFLLKRRIAHHWTRMLPHGKCTYAMQLDLINYMQQFI